MVKNINLQCFIKHRKNYVSDNKYNKKELKVAIL